MASVPFFKSSNQVSFSTSGRNHGYSKAQMCLKKIVDIISSTGISRGSSSNPQLDDGLKPDETALVEKDVALFPCHRGFDIDLNLRLGPPLETEGSENLMVNGGFSACSAVGEPVAGGEVCVSNVDCNLSAVSVDVSMIERSSEGECDPKDVGNSSDDFAATKEDGGMEAVEEETREISEITNLQVRSSGTDDTRVCEETKDVEVKQSQIIASEYEQEERVERVGEKSFFWSKTSKNDGHLSLLVEAARLISGNFEDEESDPKETSDNGGPITQEASGDSLKRTEAEAEAEAETETKEQVGCSSKRNWMFDYFEGFEDISPVVRSKRGRNQVLPCRYRDSVIEPWKRLPRQRSTRVAAKRRPR